MMKTRKYIVPFIGLLAVLAACVSEFDANLDITDQELLIVEGNIAPNTEISFFFSKSFSLNENEPPEGYDNVWVTLVVVGDNGYRSEPAVYQGNGKHTLQMGPLDSNVAYGIEFEYDGNTYRSDLSKPIPTPAIEEVSWIQPEKNAPVTVRVTTALSEQSEPVYYHWTYEEDWEMTATYYTTLFLDPQIEEFYGYDEAPYYYCWKNKKNTNILISSTESLTENRILNKPLYEHNSEDDRYSLLYSTIIRQRAISKAAYEYYENKAKLHEETGGLFGSQPSEVEGNISCITDPERKVIGFINVSENVDEKRIYINHNEISKRYIQPECQEMTAKDMREYMGKNDYSLSLVYSEGYRPNGIWYGNGQYEIWFWYQARCTDCRERGGNKNKPSFWPNDHE